MEIRSEKTKLHSIRDWKLATCKNKDEVCKKHGYPCDVCTSYQNVIKNDLD